LKKFEEININFLKKFVDESLKNNKLEIFDKDSNKIGYIFIVCNLEKSDSTSSKSKANFFENFY